MTFFNRNGELIKCWDARRPPVIPLPLWQIVVLALCHLIGPVVGPTVREVRRLADDLVLARFVLPVLAIVIGLVTVNLLN